MTHDNAQTPHQRYLDIFKIIERRDEKSSEHSMI
jgi:hypothetical protein